MIGASPTFRSTMSPRTLAGLCIPSADAAYYVTVAAPEDYGAVDALSAGADRSEVTFPLTTATIRWLVDDNPAGPGFLVVARQRADDAVVGYFLFYPKRLMVRAAPGDDPSPRMAYLYVRLFVAREYRRRGVFTAMTRYGLRLLAELGVRFAYTVPNPQSTPGFEKLGIGRLGTVPFWVSPSGWLGMPLTLVAAAVSTVTRRRVEVVPGARFDERHEALAAEAPPTGAAVWGARSLAELRWRFESRASPSYELWNLMADGSLVGYVVGRRLAIRSTQTTVVCDTWIDDRHGHALGPVMSALRSRPGASARQLLIAMCGGGRTGTVTAQLGAGMLPVPQRLLPQPVVVLGGPVEGSVASAPWMRPRGLAHWFVTPYDWDVF